MDREKEMLKDKNKPLMWSKQLYVGKLSIDLEPTCIYCDHIKKNSMSHKHKYIWTNKLCFENLRKPCNSLNLWNGLFSFTVLSSPFDVFFLAKLT